MKAEMTRQPHINAESTQREYVKFFGVVFLLFAAAVLMSTTVRFEWSGLVRWFMGGFLLIFGGFKLIDYETFVSVYPRYNAMARRYKTYAYAYPLLEVLLGMCYILDYGVVVRDTTTFTVMLIGAMGVFSGLTRKGPTFHATCLGRAMRLPLSTVLLFSNSLFVVLAFCMLLVSLRLIPT